MSDKLVDKSCAEFASELAAKVSVPGGGGAAAMVGALGAALCSMSGVFTAGKEKFADVEDDMQRMLAEAERIRLRLIELVDEDAAAFFPLSKAYGIPKEDPTRAETLEKCTKDALAGPLEMVREVCKTIDLLEEMAAKCSRLIVSDSGCGATLCRAALEAAAMNVFINTKTLTDRAFADEVEGEVDGLMNEYMPKAEAVAASVMEYIRG